jgi:hypothetical protein
MKFDAGLKVDLRRVKFRVKQSGVTVRVPFNSNIPGLNF